MDILPPTTVPANNMLHALGEVMEQEEEIAEQERQQRKQQAAEGNEEETEQLMSEIEKLVASGKGWTSDERRKYLDELHDGPELPMFCEDTNEMDPRMLEALAALKYDGELPEDLAEQAKIDGNKNYKTAVARRRKMYYREAVKHYTEGVLHSMKAIQGYEAKQAALGDDDAAAAAVSATSSSSSSSSSGSSGGTTNEGEGEKGGEKEEKEEPMTPEEVDAKLAEVKELLATLLANRAACNLALRNYGSVKRDCGDSLRYKPGNAKAYFRRAKACLELRQYEDGLDAAAHARRCQELGAGGAGGGDPAAVVAAAAAAVGALEDTRKLEVKLRAGLEERRRREAVVAAREEKAYDESLALFEAVRARGAWLGPSGKASEGYTQQASDKLPEVDPEERSSSSSSSSSLGGGDAAPPLAWPVLLLYPQYMQSDFVEACAESTMIAELLGMVFPEEEESGPAAWDERFEYRASEMEVYLQVHPAGAVTGSGKMGGGGTKPPPPAAAVAAAETAETAETAGAAGQVNMAGLLAGSMRCETAEAWADWSKLVRAAKGEVAAIAAEDARKQLQEVEKALPYPDEQRWLRVHVLCSLADCLRHPDCVVPGGKVMLHLFPRQSAAHAEWLKVHGKRVAQLMPSDRPTEATGLPIPPSSS